MEEGREVEEPERPLRITPDMLLGRRVDFERRMRRLPRLTLGIIAVLAAIFAGEVALDALDSRDGLLALGALERSAVAAGEYWRLVTAPWLHGSFGHLFSNAVALFILGMVCEHAFGRGQYFVLYVASGVVGSMLSLVLSPAVSVGASGAIFGLQGAAIVLFSRYRARLVVRDHRIGVVLLVWAIYTIARGFVTPYVDNGAHIGGALGGVLLACRLHPVVLEPMPAERAHAVHRWAGVTIAVLVLAGLGWMFR